MHLSIAFLVSAITLTLGVAATCPTQVTLVANFVANATNPISGQFKFTSKLVQLGLANPVTVTATLNGLQPSISGYMAHVHVKPVTNNDCAATLGHYNPTNANYAIAPCDPTRTATTCEVGDITGKHGFLSSSATGVSTYSVVDNELMLYGVNSILGLSVVVHAPNGTRLACANLVQA